MKNANLLLRSNSIRQLSTLALIISSFLGFSACPRKKPRSSKLTGSWRPPMQITVFTDSSPVKSLVALGDNLWVGSENGLIRWNLSTGQSRILTQDDGLPADRILALATDGKNGLWVATSAGIVRYQEGRWRQFGDCPLGVEVEALAATDDGRVVWAGGPKGLARYLFGRWQWARKNTSVTALLTATGRDAVWVGTQSHGVMHCASKKCISYGPAQGLLFKRITGLSYGLTALMAIGSSDSGDMLGAFVGNRWFAYRPVPSVLLQWVSFAMGKTFLAAGEKVYNMEAGIWPATAKPGLRLVGSRSSPGFRLHRLAFPSPSNVTQVAGARGYLWIGTQSLGVARFDGKRYLHFRTKDLGKNARFLAVACHGPIDTYVANGQHAFKYDGTNWTRLNRIGDDINVEAQYFLNDPDGAVTSIYRIPGGQMKVATRGKNDKWTGWTLQKPISGPGAMTVSAAAFDARKRLWIGLAYQDRQNELQGYGSVTVDPSSGSLTYHRNFQGRSRPQARSLSLPNDVTSIVLVGTDLWVTTMNGACRVRNNTNVRCYTEGDGLGSDLIRGVVEGPDGKLWFASLEGISTFDGRRFSSKKGEGLEQMIRSITMSKGDRVWAATNEGLVLYNRGNTYIYDEDAGLLQNKTLFVTRDRRDRIWVLHESGISVLKDR